LPLAKTIRMSLPLGAYRLLDSIEQLGLERVLYRPTLHGGDEADTIQKTTWVRSAGSWRCRSPDT